MTNVFKAAEEDIILNDSVMIVRVDGVAFHTFTRNMSPFDATIRDSMIEAAIATMRAVPDLVIGYTQNDECSFIFKNSSGYYGRRAVKLGSVLSSMYTNFFVKKFVELTGNFPARFYGFDGRAFSLPNTSAFDYLLWRYRDAVKNGITTIALQHYSHMELVRKSTAERVAMLLTRCGIDLNKYEPHYLHGTFITRGREAYTIDHDEFSKLPPKHAARKDPNHKFFRTIFRQSSHLLRRSFVDGILEVPYGE